jgi:hypothetical protein
MATDGSNHASIAVENQSLLLVGSAERSSAFAPGQARAVGNYNASDQLWAVVRCVCVWGTSTVARLLDGLNETIELVAD